MVEPCGHTASTHIHLFDLLRRSYLGARHGDAAWRELSQQARSLCPSLCAEVVQGQHDGSVPAPGTAQWDDYLDRRTGTTRQARAAVLEPPQDKTASPSTPAARAQPKKRRPPQQASPTRKPQDQPRNPLRRTAFERYTHATLAQRWAAITGDQITTDVLAVLLKVPHTQVGHYARMIADALEEPPWRLRVRGKTVDGRQLQERVDDILRALQDRS